MLYAIHSNQSNLNKFIELVAYFAVDREILQLQLCWSTTVFLRHFTSPLLYVSLLHHLVYNGSEPVGITYTTCRASGSTGIVERKMSTSILKTPSFTLIFEANH